MIDVYYTPVGGRHAYTTARLCCTVFNYSIQSVWRTVCHRLCTRIVRCENFSVHRHTFRKYAKHSIFNNAHLWIWSMYQGQEAKLYTHVKCEECRATNEKYTDTVNGRQKLYTYYGAANRRMCSSKEIYCVYKHSIAVITSVPFRFMSTTLTRLKYNAQNSKHKKKCS